MASSNLVLLEHVNLNLPREAAHLAHAVFLERGLGFLEDPRPAAWGKATRLLWADSGLQQLHLPLVAAGNAEGDVAPQVLRGEAGLACASAADAAAVRARLAALAPELEGTRFSLGEDDEGLGEGGFRFVCPFGGRYAVFALAPAPGPCAPRFPPSPSAAPP